MTLLDYAINASLVLSYVVMRKEDKAGLVTFNEHFDTFIPASRQPGQMQALLENLYSQQTTLGDRLFLIVRTFEQARQQTQSFGAVYQFSGIGSLKSPVGLFAAVEPPAPVAGHLLRRCRSEEYVATPARDTEGYYRHVIAEKFVFEKRLIVSTLKQHGISSVLTTPEIFLWT